jgi:transcriptional regulator with XRE-family HTH domain
MMKLLPRDRNGEFDARIGANIRAIRECKRVSRETVGAACGISQQQIQKYESGKNRIAASQLFRIAQILGVPVEDFFAGLDGDRVGIDYSKTLSENKRSPKATELAAAAERGTGVLTNRMSDRQKNSVT